MNDNAEELLPIVDVNGKVIGKATRKECHARTFILHPVVHLHVINDKGEIFLQRRPDWKQIQPGKWDTAVGGHIGYGEDIQTALKRETVEELGIEITTPQYITAYNFKSSVETERVSIYFICYNGDINPSEETDGGRFWAIDEIIKNIGNGVFTPNFEDEFSKFVLPYISCFLLMNLPPISAKLIPHNKGFKIYDSLRTKYVALTPEEAVRQRFSNWLITQLNYPKSLMNNEIEIKHNNRSRRCDTIVYSRQCKPLMIIEYKAPTINISQMTFDQIVRYNMVLEAKYLVVSNGLTHYCCIIDYENNTYNFIEEIPSYNKLY